MYDLTVPIGDHSLVIRVGSVVVRGTRTLLCRGDGDEFWYLPGGRVQAGETLVDAVQRELREELTCKFEIVRAIAFAENFFVMNGVRYQELGTYFVSTLLGDESEVPSREGKEIRRWFDIDTARGMGIKPDFAVELLQDINQPFRMISNRDGVGMSDIPISP